MRSPVDMDMLQSVGTRSRGGVMSDDFVPLPKRQIRRFSFRGALGDRFTRHPLPGELLKRKSGLPAVDRTHSVLPTDAQKVKLRYEDAPEYFSMKPPDDTHTTSGLPAMHHCPPLLLDQWHTRKWLPAHHRAPVPVFRTQLRHRKLGMWCSRLLRRCRRPRLPLASPLLLLLLGLRRPCPSRPPRGERGDGFRPR